MSRKIRKFCASCHKEIIGNDYEIEGDIRGVIRRIYHAKCVMVKKFEKGPEPIINEVK